MSTAKVLQYSGKSLISRMIRWQTRSKYSHSAIVVNNRLYESLEGVGVKPGRAINFEDISKHNDYSLDVFYVPCCQRELDIMEEFLVRQVGKKYDYTMVVRFETRQQAPTPKQNGAVKKVKNKLGLVRDQSNRWFCSELVYAAFLKVGKELLRETEPWEVSPGLLGRSPYLLTDQDMKEMYKET